MQKSKTCTKCHQLKPICAFYINTYTSSGLYSWCKTCHNTYCMAKSVNYYCKRKEYFKERYSRSYKHQQSLLNKAQRGSQRVREHIVKSGVWYYAYRHNIESYLNRFLRSRVPRFRGLGEYMQNIWNAYGGDPMQIHGYYVRRAKTANRKPYNPNSLCQYAGGLWCRWEQLQIVREEHYYRQRVLSAQS